MKGRTKMSKWSRLVVAVLVCTACQYTDNYLCGVDGGTSTGVSDGGYTDTDTDSDMDTDTDSDTDTDDPDSGVTDAAAECECVVGPCCDGCHLYEPEDEVLCDTELFFRCDGLCGDARVEMLEAEKFCDGLSDSCTGLWAGVWVVLQECGINKACIDGSSTACMDCEEYGCEIGTEYCDLPY